VEEKKGEKEEVVDVPEFGCSDWDKRRKRKKEREGEKGSGKKRSGEGDRNKFRSKLGPSLLARTEEKKERKGEKGGRDRLRRRLVEERPRVCLLAI